MKKGQNISDTEWKVMELLWKRPMLTIGEIKQGLKDSGWSDSTIKTLVRRLTQKGAVGIDDSQGQFRYYPVIREEESKRKETNQFLQRIYHGSLKMLMANLVPDSKLTEAEARQLMEIIEKMDGGGTK